MTQLDATDPQRLEYLLATKALLDKVYPADVMAVWDGLRVATDHLRVTPTGTDAELSELRGRAGHAAHQARTLAAVASRRRRSDSHDTWVRELRRTATRVVTSAGEEHWPGTEPQDLVDAFRAVREAAAEIVSKLDDGVCEASLADSAEQLVRGAAALDLGAHSSAAAPAAASVTRLTQIWGTHGVVDSRQTPRT